MLLWERYNRYKRQVNVIIPLNQPTNLNLPVWAVVSKMIKASDHTCGEKELVSRNGDIDLCMLTASPCEREAPLRVAIVGSGLAGLATAYFLQPRDERTRNMIHIELFERNRVLGMDSESVTVQQDGQPRRIDVPMRAFSKGTMIDLILGSILS